MSLRLTLRLLFSVRVIAPCPSLGVFLLTPKKREVGCSDSTRQGDTPNNKPCRMNLLVVYTLTPCCAIPVVRRLERT